MLSIGEYAFEKRKVLGFILGKRGSKQSLGINAAKTAAKF